MIVLLAALVAVSDPQVTQNRAEAYYHFALGEQARLAGDQDGALAEYRKAQRLDGGSGAILIEEAKLLRDGNKLDEAIVLGEQAVKLSPGDAEAHLILGELYRGEAEVAKDPTSDLKKAVGEFEAFIKINPQDRMVLLQTADLYARGLQDHKQAARVLEQYVSLDPGNAEAALELGAQYLSAGDAERAAATLKHALELEPGSAKAYANLAAIYAGAQQTDQAILNYRKALEIEPTNVKTRLELGDVLFKAQRFKEAKAEAATILTQDTKNPYALNLKASCERDEKDLDSAMATADELLALEPGDPKASFLKVTIAEAKHDFAQSAAVIETLLGRKPALEEGAARLFLIHLGYAYEQLNRPGDAADIFAKAQKVGGEPDPSLLGYEVEALLQAKSFDKALQTVRAARASFPDDVELAGLEADALRETGQGVQAKALLEDLVKKNPKDVKVIDDLADFYQRMHQFGEAEATLRKALVIEPKSLRTLFELGASLERQKKSEEAEGIFRKALDVQPDSAPVLNYLGYMNAERGVKLDEALSMIERAVTIDQENGAYQDSLGYALMRLDRVDQAEAHFQKALLSQGQNAVVLDHFGDLLEKKGKTAEAVQYWKKALDGEDAEGELDRARVERKMREALASLDAQKKTP